VAKRTSSPQTYSEELVTRMRSFICNRLDAVSLLFPNGDGSYDLIVKHWMPRGKVIEAESRDRVPYRQWAAEGLIELTEGNAIDQRLIFRRVCELHEKYPFARKQIRLTDYNAVSFIQDLQTEGFDVVAVSPRPEELALQVRNY